MLAGYDRKEHLHCKCSSFFTSALEGVIQAQERTLNSGQNESPSTVQPPCRMSARQSVSAVAALVSQSGIVP